ncbi:MAG: FG-GAP-like repeat-containing protein [Reichenbachiella sp.]|uniref:FG-GAP-like repeat-containing protein n=1 Tax=Reichenbachiella sp. TaxID=2184521 RepID=UPI0032990224
MKTSFLPVAFCLITTLGMAQPTFEQSDSYHTGGSLYGLKAGDFNNDGLMDMVTANFTSAPESVNILIGHSFYGFQITDIGTVSSNIDLDTADFNLDGNLDFVVASNSNDLITLFLGNGDGTFASTAFGAGEDPLDIVTGDFDKDTHPDVAVLHRFSDDMYVYYGDGQGGLGTPQIIPIESTAYKMTTADFDNDGDLDLLTGGSTSVEFHAGDGAGNFSSPVPSTGFFDFVHMSSADFDDDGNLDILAAETTFLYRAFGNGDGTFSDIRFFPEGGNAAVAVDFNEDGMVDVASSRYMMNYYEGEGTRDFTISRRNQTGTGRGIAAADWDNDGNLDLATAGGPVVNVVYGKGNGFFKTPNGYQTPYDTHGLALGDFNEDGLEDIAVCAATTIAHLTDNLFIYEGQAGGGMIPVDTLDAGFPWDIETLDINGDTHMDIAILDSWNNQVKLFTGDGTGSLAAAGNFSIAAEFSMSSSDVNKDGLADLILVGGSLNNVEIHKSNGDDTFTLLIDLDATEEVEDAIVADFNGDTEPDLAVIVDPSSGSDQVRFFQGDGLGGFTAAGTNIDMIGGAVTLTKADVNDDGNMDLVVATGSDADILLGDGTFAFTVSSVNTNVNEVTAVADFDGDGFKDLLASRDGTMSMYNGDGTGNFHTNWSWGLSGAGGFRLAISDFNDDGYDDIATLWNGSPLDGLNILLNSSAPPPCVPAQIDGTPASNISRCEGEGVSLAITASGDASLSYQWKKDGVDVIGATSSFLFFANLESADAGTYVCTVSNACGSESSTPSNLTINTLPAVPSVVGAIGCSPSTVVLTASGASDGDYRWYDVASGGTALVGEVNSSFTTPSLNVNTNYYVAIDNGSCESSRVLVVATIVEPAAITTQPASQSNDPGEDVTLTLVAAGENISYQWKKDGTAIDGETASSLDLTNFDSGDVGDYTCEVSNSCATVESTAVTLSLNSALLNVTENWLDGEVCEEAAASFTVSATGTTNISYQWQESGGTGFMDISDDNQFSGTNTSTLSISNVSLSMNGFQYQCIVSGDHAADKTSAAVGLVVIEKVSLSSQPSSQNAELGEKVTFSVDAAGDNLTFQWQKNDIDISGEMTKTLTILSLESTDAGNYSCTVSNNCSAQASTVAVLTIDNVLGIENQISAALYPNPANGVFNIALSGAYHGEIIVSVISTAGQTLFYEKMVKYSEKFEATLNLADLNPGVYFVKTSTSYHSMTIGRLVIE